jgi:hypothetical protein
MPKNGAWVLSDVAAVGRNQIDVACKKCDRRGRVSVARLLIEHGPEVPLPDLLKLLAANCPRQAAASIYDRCGVSFLNLDLGGKRAS